MGCATPWVAEKYKYKPYNHRNFLNGPYSNVRKKCRLKPSDGIFMFIKLPVSQIIRRNQNGTVAVMFRCGYDTCRLHLVNQSGGTVVADTQCPLNT